jgi:cyclopropane fatty-acyl-phospholipid synthase-like methyltransferase
VLREWVLNALRGSHNSVRHRFTTLPRLHLSYAMHRLAGGTWTDFYRKMVDRSAVASDLSAEQLDATVDNIRFQYEFLLRHGLSPHHRFLDYGCGRMRMGVHVAPYLQSGCYVGADISREAVAQGLALLQRRGIAAERVASVVLSDCKLRELAGRQFDVVWANSVVTHMPEEQVAEMLAAMRPLIAQGGRYFFSYSIADKSTRHNFQDYYYTTATIERLVTAAGYSFEVAADYDSPVPYDRMAIAVPR